MTRNDYLAKLDKYLRKLPQEDYQDSMDYFIEYFDEAGPEREAEVIAELGTPKEAAHEVISRLLDEKTTEQQPNFRNRTTIIWIAILAILASPIALPLLLSILAIIITIVAIIFSVIVTVLALIGTLLMSGLYFIVTSFSLLSTSLASTLLALGLGLGLFGLSLLLFLILFECCKLCVKVIIFLISWLIKKGRKS